MKLSIKATFRDTKPDANGRKVLYLRLTYNRVAKYLASDISLLPSEFNAEIGLATNKAKNVKWINTFIHQKTIDYTDKAEELILRGKFDFTKFVANLEKDPPSDAFYDMLVVQFNATKFRTESTKTVYRCALNSVRYFDAKSSILYWSKNKVKQYIDFLLEKHIPNTAALYFSIVKDFAAQVFDTIENDIHNHFLPFTLPTDTSMQKSYYLTVGELDLLENYYNRLVEKANLAKEEMAKLITIQTFFIQFFTGLRISDVLSLTRKEIIYENDIFYVKKRMVKTKKLINVPISPKALSFFCCHQNKKKKAAAYFFGRKIHITELNRLLKVVMIDLNIDKAITTHTARHSFGTYALNNGMRMEVVQAVMGHSTPKQTGIYAKIVDSTVLDEMNKIFQ